MSLSAKSQLRTTQPYLAWAVEYILAVANSYGGTHSITSVNRTAQEQWDLYRRPNSLAVRPGCSQHQYGLAVDVKFQDPRWQDWYSASARNFGLSTVQGDPVHVQLVPGARFREWAVPQGYCPDPSYAQSILSFDSSMEWKACLSRFARDSSLSGSCKLPCGPVYGIPC